MVNYESRDPADIFAPLRRFINRSNAERIEYWSQIVRIRPLTITARARLNRTDSKEATVHWSTLARKALSGRVK